MERRKPTVYDLAMVAGVSVAQVRAWVSGRRFLRRRQARNIADAAAGLGFIPEPSADSAPSRSLKRVAIVSPFITALSFVERIKGVGSVLSPDEYEVITCSVEVESQIDGFLYSLSRPGATDAVILMALPLSDSMSRRYRERRIPLVTIEREFPGFPSVTVDNIAGGRLAAEYLLKRGYKRPGFLGDTGIPMYAFSAADLRYKGFREYLEEVGIGLPDTRVAFHSQGSSHVPEAFVQLMKAADSPDAVFCASDAEAVVGIRTAWEMELSNPVDVGFLGFDNTELSEFVGLSSVDQFLVQSGMDAGRMAASMIERPGRVPKSICYDLKITERSTT